MLYSKFNQAESRTEDEKAPHGVIIKKKYSPSPVFSNLAEHYIDRNAHTEWSSRGGDAVSFKHEVKKYMISHINKTVEPYVKDLPFLKIDLPQVMEKNDHILDFYKELRLYLNERKIFSVIAQNREGSYMVPRRKETLERLVPGKISYADGFEIVLEHGSIRRMLTTFSHEIAHTYFYDISKNPPQCLISNETLKRQEWYREFEGLAFELGREILLPREAFKKYLTDKYSTPSLSNFLRMYSSLHVSRDVLASRLVRDGDHWKACVFWGKVANGSSVSNENQEPEIVVRSRDIRNGFSFSLPAQLENRDSELRHVLLSQVGEQNSGEHTVKINKRKYSFEVITNPLENGEFHFTAIIHKK